MTAKKGPTRDYVSSKRLTFLDHVNQGKGVGHPYWVKQREWASRLNLARYSKETNRWLITPAGLAILREFKLA